MPLPAIAAGAARGLATAGRGLAKSAPEEEEEAPEEKKDKTSTLLSPEGILMMFVGGILDILSIIGAILILALGAGLLFAKIVYIVGLIIVGSWAFFRSGTLPAGKQGGLAGKKGGRTLLRFLRRQWPKLAGKVVPAIGDALPLWTWTIYSELTAE